jgi:hypothetical protein
MVDRDDIIRMAREAGCKPFRSPEHWDDVQVFATPNVLERFAALVAAAEREACAKLCLEEANEAYHQEAFYLPRGNQGLLRIAEGAKRCAEAIRARGEQ